MVDSEHADDIASLLAAERAVRALGTILAVEQMTFERGSGSFDIEKRAVEFAKNAGNIIRSAGLKHPDLDAACLEWAKGRTLDKGDNKLRSAAPPLLEDHLKELRDRVSRRPNDLTKARGTVEGFYRYYPGSLSVAYMHGHPDRLAMVAKDTNDKAILKLLDQGSGDPPYETYARYRLLRSLPKRASQTEANHIESEFRLRFEQMASDAANSTPPESFLPFQDIGDLVEAWLSSRDDRLRAALFSSGRRLAHELLRWQQPTGRWHYWWYHNRQDVASPGLTALMMAFCTVFADPEEHSEALSKGLNSLLRDQLACGAWSWLSEDTTADTLATVAALDTLKRHSPTDSVSAAEAATDYLLNCQTELGGWTFDRMSWEMSSVLAVEIIEATYVGANELAQFLRHAKEMLYKAEELSGARATVDLQLAVIAAHHACEIFLYGCFSRLDPQETYIGADGRTVGLSAAMSILERRLKADSALSGALPHRQQVQHLATARDAITHRGITVSSADTKAHVSAARRFIDHHSRSLLGNSIL